MSTPTGSFTRISCLLTGKEKIGTGLIIKDIRSHIYEKTINRHEYEKKSVESQIMRD